MQPVLEKNHISYPIAIAVIFPELVRYSALRDKMEITLLKTLYNSLRVSDNWGKLTVDKGGCLVSNNLKFVRITAKAFKADKNHVSGEGWHLLLNNSWELVPVEQNYFVRKLMP